MDIKIYNQSRKAAKKIMRLASDPAHDFYHAQSVAKNAAIIGRELNYPDIKFLELAAWWHDTGRLYKKKHEKLSAEMARKNLLLLGADKRIAQKIYKAIESHQWSMQPQTLEGKIIKDADKLDFLSISRWERSKKAKNKYRKSIIPILPKLKDILSQKISKAIYDKKIKKFYSYIK